MSDRDLLLLLSALLAARSLYYLWRIIADLPSLQTRRVPDVA